MDGTLGSQTALDARRLRRPDHERRGARGDRAARRRGRLPGRRARDRRPREPRGARRVRGDARASGRRSACASGSSTRSCSRPEDIAALRRARRRRVGAVLPRAVRPRPRRPLLGGQDRGAYAYRSLLDSGAVVANGSDAPIEELDPLAGHPRRRPAHDRRARAVAPRAGAHRRSRRFEATTVAPAWLAGDERRRGKLLPGYAADLVVLDRDPWDDLDAQVVATMVAGRWVHNPPPWRLTSRSREARASPRPAVRERGSRLAPAPVRWVGRPAAPSESRRIPLRVARCELCDRFANSSSTASPERATTIRARSESGRRAEELARGGDPERDVLGEEPLVRRVDVRVGQREARDDRRDRPCPRAPARSAACRPSGSAPAAGRARARTRRARAGSRVASGGTSPGGADDQSSIVELGARRAPPRAAAARPRARSPRRVWPGARRIERFATASTGSTVFWSCGEPPSIPFTSSAGSANVRR